MNLDALDTDGLLDLIQDLPDVNRGMFKSRSAVNLSSLGERGGVEGGRAWGGRVGGWVGAFAGGRAGAGLFGALVAASRFDLEPLGLAIRLHTHRVVLTAGSLWDAEEDAALASLEFSRPKKMSRSMSATQLAGADLARAPSEWSGGGRG